MMKFLRPSTIRGAFLPAMLTNWVHGMGVIEYPEGRPRPFVSACWSLLHVAYFLSIVKFARIPKFSNVNGSTLAADNLRVAIVTFLILVIVCLVADYARAKEWRNVVRKIANINTVLKSFGISEEYDAIFNTQVVELGIGIGIMIVATVLFYLRPKHPSYTKRISLQLLMHYMWSFYSVNGWCLTIILRYIRNRFKQLNDYIVQENGGEKTKNGELSRNTMVLRNQVFQFAPITFEVHGDRRMIKETNKRWLLYVIRKTRNIHCDLVNLTKELNRVYAVQILITTTATLILIVVFTYSLYVATISVSMDKYQKFSVLVPISIATLSILFIGNLWAIVRACSTTSSEAQRTGKLIHELVNPNSDNAFRNEVRLFALQLMQNPLHFNACGFFTVDYELFQGMVGSIVTFLVILIQMRNIWDVQVHSGDYSASFFRNGTLKNTN